MSAPSQNGAQAQPPADLSLEPGERHLARFPADRQTYLRGQIQLAAIAAVGSAALLWVLGNADIWAGPVAALAAIGLRGWYLASEELAYCWDLTDQRVLGPGGRAISLGQIVTVRRLGNIVQIITEKGDKHLIKAQKDPLDTLTKINHAKDAAHART